MPDAQEQPHDILAADEFAIPGQEPGVPHELDPEPHDVLAAEEFAFPAGAEPIERAAHRRPAFWLVAGGLVGLIVLGRRRRR
jgi:hypothetical protein